MSQSAEACPSQHLWFEILCKNIFLIQMPVIPATETLTCYDIHEGEKDVLEPWVFIKWAIEF